MFGSLKFGRETNHLSRSILPIHINQILNNWRDSLLAKGIALPQPAEREFVKRTSTKSKAKAKLNLNGCKLDDNHVIALVEALQFKPRISKLILSNNAITNQGVNAIIQLLIHQVQLTQAIPINELLDLSFLGEVDLNSNSTAIDNEALVDVRLLTTILKRFNAQAHIRSIYNKYDAPISIPDDIAAKIFMEAAGNQNISNRQRLKDGMTYDQLEYEIMNLLVATETIRNLTDMEKERISQLLQVSSSSEQQYSMKIVTPSVTEDIVDAKAAIVPIQTAEPSSILSPEQFDALATLLPETCKISRIWNLNYCLLRDGASLETFMRLSSMKDRHGKPMHSSCVMIIQDIDGYIFGGYIAHALEKRASYYGNGESFVFTLAPTCNAYRWTGENNFFVMSNNNGFAMGGGGDGFAFQLDDELNSGVSNQSATFNNKQLSARELFQCSNVELWVTHSN